MSNEILAEKKVHEHGYVRLVGVFGSDKSIEAAARISYGGNEKPRTEAETRGLIRYLMRYRHTSPFEQASVQFELKLPIFVMRQHVRHRTAKLNEYSLRYSEALDDFYVPEESYIKPQSTDNKQGRSGRFDELDIGYVETVIEECNERAFREYKKLRDGNVARELARAVLPVSNYTKCVWQCDLHNFFHYLKLRTDSHAQQEIQDFANAMLELAEPHFPLSFEAWRDYSKEARTFSRMELQLLSSYIKQAHTQLSEDAEPAGFSEAANNLSGREQDEFLSWYTRCLQ